MKTLDVAFDFEFYTIPSEGRAFAKRQTLPISLGAAYAQENGELATFYEVFDFDLAEACQDDWIAQNVIKRLYPNQPLFHPIRTPSDAETIAARFQDWIPKGYKIRFWGDHVAYDWVLLCELFGGMMQLTSDKDRKNWAWYANDIAPKLEALSVAQRIHIDATCPNKVPHNALCDAMTILRQQSFLEALDV